MQNFMALLQIMLYTVLTITRLEKFKNRNQNPESYEQKASNIRNIRNPENVWKTFLNLQAQIYEKYCNVGDDYLYEWTVKIRNACTSIPINNINDFTINNDMIQIYKLLNFITVCLLKSIYIYVHAAYTFNTC